jgi:UDP-2,4-diacetamido-2,4,6-trideoxy-beta-L-altropyranose hydrolase
MKLTLREATTADAELLFRWRNEAETRKNSFGSGPIPFEEHIRWLSSRLTASDDTRIWILEDGTMPVGQIRYERVSDEARISFSIDKNVRGKGLGTALLKLTAPLACQTLGVEQLVGMTKPDNIPSIRSFERAGFRQMPFQSADLGSALVFVWKPSFA